MLPPYDQYPTWAPNTFFYEDVMTTAAACSAVHAQQFPGKNRFDVCKFSEGPTQLQHTYDVYTWSILFKYSRGARTNYTGKTVIL